MTIPYPRIPAPDRLPNPGFLHEIGGPHHTGTLPDRMRPFNVRAFGAKGDGTTDDTAAIQAAFDAARAALVVGTFAGPPVEFPVGRFVITDTLEWKAHPIVGAGSWGTHIIWGGAAGGTAIDGTGAGRQEMKGLQFRSGKPGIWIDKSGTTIDWHDFMEDVFFGDYSITALNLGGIINCYMRDLRFALGDGYCITVNHGNSGARTFSLDNFTFDSASVNAACPGFIELNGAGSNSGLAVRLANARLEAASQLVAPAALIAMEGSWALVGGTIHLENIQAQLGSQGANPSVIYKNTTDTNSGVALTIANCSWGGFTNVLGGTWAASFVKPAMPSGQQTRFWALGRQISGASVTNHTQVERVNIGSEDTNLYRSAADTLKTDDKMHIVGELELDGALNHDGTAIGFFGTTPATQQTVSGDRRGNAALGDLLTELAEYGLVTDSTTEGSHFVSSSKWETGA